MMRISREGLALVKAFEGFYPNAYRCPAGVLTIGYGHTNLAGQPPRIAPGDRMTEAEASAVLDRDLDLHEGRVNRLILAARPSLSQGEFDAAVSFDYNTGGLTLAGGALSATARAMIAGDRATVRARLARWNRGGGRVLAGLVRRREAEADLWDGNTAEALATAGANRNPVARDRRRPPVPRDAVARDLAAPAAGAAAGTAVTGTAATSAAGPEGPPVLVTVVAIALGLAVLAAAGALLWRRYRRLAAEWS